MQFVKAKRLALSVISAVIVLAGVLVMLLGDAKAVPEPGKIYGDWGTACEENVTRPGEQCYIFQNLMAEDTGRVLHFAVGYLGKDDKPMGIITVPLGLYLPAGIAFKVDEGQQYQAQLQTCDMRGCRAYVNLTNDIIDEFKSGEKTRVAFMTMTQQQMVLPVSLKGFTSAYKSLN